MSAYSGTSLFQAHYEDTYVNCIYPSEISQTIVFKIAGIMGLHVCVQ